MFFFQETYDLRDQMIERYPRGKFVNGGTKMTPEQQEEQYGAELWKRDPNKCCQLRKVDPMLDVMADTDVWITGLRRSQSVARANLRLIEWDWRYQVLKISPLVKWERPKIWEYIQKEDIPITSLYFDKGEGKRYRSLGCQPCTGRVDSTATSVAEIVEELKTGKFVNIAERSGRQQDNEDGGGLETLRREGYM